MKIALWDFCPSCNEKVRWARGGKRNFRKVAARLRDQCQKNLTQLCGKCGYEGPPYKKVEKGRNLDRSTMTFYVKQSRYNHKQGRVVDDLVEADVAIRDALLTTDHGILRERKSLEDQVKAVAGSTSRLMATLLGKGILNPQEVEDILGWECQIEGEFVEVLS